ncbi:MAG: COX15/CtaA family protein [Verrucomicrobiales bacterium]|nr:COX15/CtaA family protein [Verrucomicrobiales bacterium]
MPHSPASSRGLHAYAWLTALATLGLIGLGGLVTSHGAGMAVPDWPTTYGYNMFLFPISQWIGGVFYEHTHRLYASGVGFLTVVLAVWLQLRARDRALARWGWVALGLVIVQGVLGGLRVSLMKDQIGIIHASLAQAFLVLLVAIAVRLSPAWVRWSEQAPAAGPSTGRWVGAVTCMIFLQLVLGAAMRHQHAGLAVPDFPLAYGRVWPPTDDAFLQSVNALRTDTRDFNPITAAQVHLHMTHRLLAFGILAGVVVAARKLRRAFGPASAPGRLALAWKGLIGVQVILGATTVWTNKAADIATLHVVVGASCLAVGAWSTILAREASRRSHASASATGLRPVGDAAGGGSGSSRSVGVGVPA